MVLQKLISLSDTLSITVALIPEKASNKEATGVRQELQNNTRCGEEGVSFLFSLKRAMQLSHETAAKPVAPFHIFNLYECEVDFPPATQSSMKFI